MKRTTLLYLIALGLTIAACTVQTKPARTHVSPAASGYTGALEPAFYYLEGIKTARLLSDPVKAARLLDKAIELDPNHAPSYFAAADNIAPLDLGQALEYSKKANALDSANLWYRGQLGRLLIQSQQYDQARQIYGELIKISPHDPENYRMLAALYEYAGQSLTAISILDSAEYKFGRFEELSQFKRELLTANKLYDKAIDESLELIRDYPYKYENYLVIADLYAMTGKDSLAVANYGKAMELNPDGIDVLVAMNAYYKSVNDNANFLATAKKIFLNDGLEATNKIRFFNDIIQNRNYYINNYLPLSDLATTLLLKYPHDPEVVDLNASNLITGGRVEEALTLYKGYANAPGARIELFNHILEIEAYLGRIDSVNKYSGIALAHYPENVEFYIRRGGALEYMKREGEALDAYKSALKYAPTDSLRSVVLGIIGDSYHLRENANKSYSYYKKALKKNPDNVMVLNNYAYYLSIEERELDRALAMIERVMALEPGNPTYIDTYGWVLYKMGRVEEAKKAIQQAVSFDRTGSKELFVHYGDLLYETGEHFLAKYYWEKALDAGYDKEEIDQRLKKTEGK